MWPKSKEDTEQLYADTRTLLENFKPSRVAAYVSDQRSESHAQSAVYAIVKEGNEMAGEVQPVENNFLIAFIQSTCFIYDT